MTRTRSRSTASRTEYRSSQLVELRFVPDWARTIARRVLYEAADELRLDALKASPDEAVAGLAAKIDREEAYHRMHARDVARAAARRAALPRRRSRSSGRTRSGWSRPSSARRSGPASSCPSAKPSSAAPTTRAGRRSGTEMTEVRRSVPGAAW